MASSLHREFQEVNICHLNSIKLNHFGEGDYQNHDTYVIDCINHRAHSYANGYSIKRIKTLCEVSCIQDLLDTRSSEHEQKPKLVFVEAE